MFNVHALGGQAMIAAAARGAERGARESGVDVPMLIAVTVLSSLSGESLASSASLAFEARAAGAAGAVVSGDDVSTVHEVMGDEFCLVVPGIRPPGSNGHDQVRVLTPAEAIEAGADYIVVGRAITGSSDPLGAVRSILSSAR
jgi:orotidine-5'-phosphate decarboxylase